MNTGHYFPEAVEAEGEYGGTAVAYHHDDVVQELVEAARDVIDRCHDTIDGNDGYREVDGDYIDALRVALAKIAQEDQR